jgi:hypothetical protein
MPLIENPSSVEVRAVLNAKQKSPTEIHIEVVEVCGENVISRKEVSVWCDQFKEGRTSLFDEERAGRPTTACDAVNERRVEQLLFTDRRMKLKEIAYTLSGNRFSSAQEVESETRYLHANFYAEGILKLVSRWDKCLNPFGDYVEK